VANLERRFPGERHVLEAVANEMLSAAVAAVSAGGWGPEDLAELVSRRAGPRHVATIAAAVESRPRLGLGTTSGLASALQVTAVLSVAPLLRVSAEAVASSSAHPKLAKVRALLAKAESTTFDEEAEALSAKAQELITRYALGRFIGGHADDSSRERPRVRRLWLDAPYVAAKASLVHAVASANRCRSAGAGRLGFSVVVGAPADLDAVEVLVTSLLVQADTAMLRHARRNSGSAGSTRAFRRAFLFAYADRIGKRLREANDLTVSATESGRLLPALVKHDAAVSDAFEAMVPHTTSRRLSITSAEGWSAGTVAADLARLDIHSRLEGGDEWDAHPPPPARV
jgi:hypothetical protein